MNLERTAHMSCLRKQPPPQILFSHFLFTMFLVSSLEQGPVGNQILLSNRRT